MNNINKCLYFKNKTHEIINKNIENTISIYKTLNSIIFNNKNLLYCFNDDYCKKINLNTNFYIYGDFKIYSNEIFYIVVNQDRLLFIDEYFNIKCVDSYFSPSNILLKENYMVINNNLNSILINAYSMVYFFNSELYDLYDKVLFYSDKKNYIITELGLIDKKQISDDKIKKIVDVLKITQGLENFINMYFSN